MTPSFSYLLNLTPKLVTIEVLSTLSQISQLLQKPFLQVLTHSALALTMVP